MLTGVIALPSTEAPTPAGRSFRVELRRQSPVGTRPDPKPGGSHGLLSWSYEQALSQSRQRVGKDLRQFRWTDRSPELLAPRTTGLSSRGLWLSVGRLRQVAALRLKRVLLNQISCRFAATNPNIRTITAKSQLPCIRSMIEKLTFADCYFRKSKAGSWRSENEIAAECHLCLY